MKLTGIFLLAMALQVSARTNAQISFKGSNVPLKDVIAAVEKQTLYVFILDGDLLAQTKPVTLSVKHVSIDEFMRLVLQHQPLEYSIENKTIVLSRKKGVVDPVVVPVEPAGALKAAVNGRVLNPDGLPLEGASVLLKGTKKGTSTDRNGRFTIDANPGDVLVISYSGFAAREYTVTSDKDFTMTLSISENKLNEIQVMAYSTNSRRLSTSNQGGITDKEIGLQPVGNSLVALQGRVPGILITQGSGTPGATLTVRIQGIGSLRGGNNPFYVVDGVPFSSTLLNAGDNGGNPSMWGSREGSPAVGGGSAVNSLDNGGSGSPLSYLNPSDIESIEVLKDADATAIYGSRAANGAILITTKKGKPGTMKVMLNINSGWNKITRRVKLLNASQYLEMRREAYSNSGIAIPASANDLNGNWDTTRTKDWQDYLWGMSTRYFNGQLSLSGGNVYSNYLISSSFRRQTLMLPGDFADKNYSVHAALRNASANQKFKSQLSVNYLVNNNRLPAASLSADMLALPPVAPDLLKPDGSVNWATNAAGASTLQTNPLAGLTNNFIVDVNNLVSNLTLSYEILKGLEIKTSIGYTLMQMNDISTSKAASVRPELRAAFQRSATFRYNTLKAYLAEPQLRYRFPISAIKVEALAGGTFQKNENMARGVRSSGQSGDNMLENLSAGSVFSPTGDLHTVYQYAALFGSLNFNHADKYILNLTGRRDGSSRFGPENRFHSFGAVGAAWILSRESFFQLPSFISFAKIKASYGSTGNDQIGDYSYLDLYSPVTSGVAYQGIGALTPIGLVNNNLQWELTRKANVGVDLGFWKDKVLLGANYFRNRSSNLLQGFTLPTTAGVGFIFRNFNGTVQNSGWEFSLNASDEKSSGISWSGYFNLTIPKNQLRSFPDQDKLIGKDIWGYQLGQPLGLTPVYKLAGVDPLTGRYLMEDANGNLTGNPNSTTDRKIFINTISPDYYAGLGGGIGYKRFRMDFFFQGVRKTGARYVQTSTLSPGASAINQPVTLLDRWRKPGDEAFYQKLAIAYSFTLQTSDAAYEDASFIRFKNLSFSWDVPAAWISKAKLQSCRLSANIQNLATITGYSGIDPESGTLALPPFRTIVLAAQLTF